MRTEIINEKELIVPETWDDVTYGQYLTYFRKIADYAFAPLKRQFFDTINGEGAYDNFICEINTRQQGKIFVDIGFIQDCNGVPPLCEPKHMRLKNFSITIPSPLQFSEQQMDDILAASVRVNNSNELMKAEMLTEICALYCQPLISGGRYSRTEAAKLEPLILEAPCTDVISLSTMMALQATELLIKAINNQVSTLKKPAGFNYDLNKRKN